MLQFIAISNLERRMYLGKKLYINEFPAYDE